MNPLRLLAMLALTVLAMPSSAAQDDWAAVIALPAGANVRADTVDGAAVEGRVQTVDDVALVVVSATGSHRIQRPTVRRVVRKGVRNVGRSAKRGLLIGAAAGGTLGAVGGATFVKSNAGKWFVALTAGWAAVGSLAGAVTALASPKDQLVYERPSP